MLKRTPSQPRAPSPSNTTYSGISNYKTDSYRPLQKQRMPSNSIDPKSIAKVHYDEMNVYLDNHLAKEPANARASAREKLTRLTRQQFQELSTDVYDELLRRKNNTDNDEVPFLPVRDDFHPKRNQARQKLATLPKTRFKDLSGDVFHELGRRYPEFKEPETLGVNVPNLPPMSPQSVYDDVDVPSPDFPQSLRSNSVRSPPTTDSGYGGSQRRPSEDSYRRPSEDIASYRRRPSEDDSGFGRDPFGGSRRKPSGDAVSVLRRSGDDDRDLARRPSGSISTTSDSTNATNAQREMIIPNKSVIAEEEIEVPYGRERESSSTAVGGGRASRSPDTRDRSPDQRDTDEATDENNPFGDARSPRLELKGLGGGLGGLSGLTARLRDRVVEEEEEEWSGTGRSGGEDYFEKMSLGRASVASDRSAGGGQQIRTSANVSAGRMSKGGVSEDAEVLRREYEYKIATMQSRISTLERSLEESEERSRRMKDDGSEEKTRILEEEARFLREKQSEQEIAMRELKNELSTLRQERKNEEERLLRRNSEQQSEIESLRIRYQQLEMESQQMGSGMDSETIDQLRSDLEGLLSELADLSLRNDELMIAKESDLAVINNLDMQVKDYKRKYETAKTELRSFKATSQIFLKSPKQEGDQMPLSSDGGLLDIHVTAFMTAVDGLLTAGRSPQPTRVLQPMRTVINATSAILEDVRVYDRRKSRDSDNDAIRSLRERLEATLSNLATASKTHATSMGMSPVSLLDAASSHLSAAVTELGKTIQMRKATKAEQDQWEASLTSNANQNASYGQGGFVPTLRSIGEVQRSMPHHRAGSSTSQKSSPMPSFSDLGSPPGAPSSLGVENLKRRPMTPSSSVGSSPPPLFDQSRTTASTSDDTQMAEGPDEAWIELRPYLEAQSEAIVFAIQSVLSGVRSPVPSTSLNDNLTQIITIVSSIVAVCKDALPPASAVQGSEVLRELSEHANRLSEVQNARDVTKEQRQVMAKSSFAIANAMKGLMKL